MPFFSYTKLVPDPYNFWHIEVEDSLQSGNTILTYCGIRGSFGVSRNYSAEMQPTVCPTCDRMARQEVEIEKYNLSIFFS